MESAVCILLTHRRGVAAAYLQKIPENTDHFLSSCLHKSLELQVLECPVSGLHYERYQHDSGVYLRTPTQTAEGVLPLMQVLLKEDLWKCPIVLGIGPGSFTGLRLGCAFVLGGVLGQTPASDWRQTSVLGLPTLLAPQLLDRVYAHEPEQSTVCLQQLGSIYKEADPASGYVTFFDLFFAVAELSLAQSLPLSKLLPCYGKEPTPVTLLNQKQGIVL